MIKSEKTIIKLAKAYLADLKKQQKLLNGYNEGTSMELAALTVLAHAADSGLTEETTKMLLEIESEAQELTNKIINYRNV